jgi:hypothetical protein
VVLMVFGSMGRGMPAAVSRHFAEAFAAFPDFEFVVRVIYCIF